MGLIVFKLWLVSGEDIIGSATQYDALWYVRSSTHWYWGSPYDWTAFIRPGPYPLWLAVVHLLHLPQRLAIELLQLGGALTLCLAFRALGAARLVTLLCFAAIALHPAGFQLNDYTMSDTFYAALLWWVLGGLLLTLATRNGWIAAATGVLVGVLWNTREEGLLLILLLGIWTLLLLVRESRRRGPRLAIRSGAALVAVASVVILCFYTANYLRFLSFARSEMTANNFQGLFHSLLRIKPAAPKPYAPITDDTLRRAFGVSRTFAKLQPHLDSPFGEAWRVETFRRTGVQGEIGAGWIVWATRRAASDAGIFENPRQARGFFRKAAREISAACDDGRLQTRFVIDGFLDPLAQTGGLTRLPHSAMRIGGRVFALWPMEAIGDDEILTPEEVVLYDQVTLRRARGSLQHTGMAATLEDAIGRWHFALQYLLHGAALIAAVWLILGKSRRPVAPYGVAVLLLAATVLPRLALFAWLDATAFDSTGDRFLFPVLPLWSALLVLVIGAAFGSRRSQNSPA